MNSSIVIFQIGSKSFNPKTKDYYNPWENHIWTCLEQARKWSPNSKIVVVLDDENVYGKENFEKLNIQWERIDQLESRYNVDAIGYWQGDADPMWRACGMRPFYIEAVMKKHNLKNTFTFDNDVMLYCDLDEVAQKLSKLYYRTAMTAEHESAMIFGMVYIRNADAITEINDKFWEIMNRNDSTGQNSIDMFLWKRVQNEMGESYVSTLPIWPEGSLSKFYETVGGIFDPSSIGQHFGGCNNGNPPGVIFQHQYIGRMLMTNKWKFGSTKTQDGKRFFFVEDQSTGNKTKILSIHVHGKGLKNYV